MDPKKVDAIILKIEEIIALRDKQLGLLFELRRAYVLAQLAGVEPDEIARSGFDPELHMRQRKAEYHRLKVDGVTGARQMPSPCTNYVVLRDGRRIDIEPLEEV